MCPPVDISKIDKITKLVEHHWHHCSPNKPVTGKRLFWLIGRSGARQEAGRWYSPAMTPYLPDLVGGNPHQIVLGSFSGKASVSTTWISWESGERRTAGHLVEESRIRGPTRCAHQGRLVNPQRSASLALSDSHGGEHLSHSRNQRLTSTSWASMKTSIVFTPKTFSTIWKS